jgi:DNA-binding transcriptional ArsR family regulator
MTTKGLPPLDGAVATMRCLADGTRLRLLMLLSGGEVNVSSLCAHTGLAQPTVSHHLGLLRMAGLVYARRQGRSVLYRLATESPAPDSVRVVAGGAVITITPLHVASPR